MFERIRNFALWVSANLTRLRHSSAPDVAADLAEELLKIDPRLGVEVSEYVGGQDREVIVTAYSDPSLFQVVRQIVELLSENPGWRFVALKPPRGCAFTITLGDHKLRASTLEFTSILDWVCGVQPTLPVARLGDLREERMLRSSRG